MAGAGKSYFVKLMALRNLLAGVDFLIIDPENEYGAVCDAADGQYIRLASSSAHHLNPFDLPPPGRRRSETARRAGRTGHRRAGSAGRDAGASPAARSTRYERAVLDRAALPGVRAPRASRPIRPRTRGPRRCSRTCRRRWTPTDERRGGRPGGAPAPLRPRFAGRRPVRRTDQRRARIAAWSCSTSSGSKKSCGHWRCT